jgi:succinate dehydrogenase/fumarate reductase flavoprotein subunit
MNRMMVFDLIGDNRGTFGAIGLSTREDKLVGFRAKSIVLGTGQCNRLYPSSTPRKLFNMAMSPNTTGDGRAMAHRIGAELANMEVPYRHAGPKYFARAGKATWIGVYRDPYNRPVAPFVTKPERKYGDIAGDIYKKMFSDYYNSGKGPLYMDCRGISEADYKYMMYWMKHEGNSALINYLEEEGVDPRKNPIEFAAYEMAPLGGVNYNQNGETSVRGLYAAGDELLSGFIGVAATIGWLTGKASAEFAKKVKFSAKKKMIEKLQEKSKLLKDFCSRREGPEWTEVNAALQQIMLDYAGTIRSETLLNSGLAHLRRLKKKAYDTMIAINSHELARCMEVLNLMDLAEVIFIAAIERKETRGTHVRVDFPFTNPLLNKTLVIKKVDGKVIKEWKEIKR